MEDKLIISKGRITCKKLVDYINLELAI